MAEKILNTRIQLKYDSYTNWTANNPVLKKGEIAIATMDSNADGVQNSPNVIIKVGDGTTNYKALKFASALAADVLAACKTEAGLKAFINGVIADAGIATNEAMEALAGRVTTTESDIDALEVKVGSETVAKQISDAIATLDLANTYDAKGAAATAEQNAKDYADGKDEAIAAAKKAGDDAQADVDALELKVGTVPKDKDIVTMISEAQTAATYDDTQVKADIKTNTDAIDAIEADYLKAADKTVLEGKITAEKERAEGIEGGLRTDIDVIKADYLKASDKLELQNQINTIMNNPDTEGIINSISEFTQYIADHGEIAEGFRTDIDANAKAIEDLGTANDNKFETKTDASKKLDEAKKHATDLNTAMDTRVKALESVDHEHTNAEELAKIAVGDKAKWDATEQNAKDYADSLADNYDAAGTAQELIDGLDVDAVAVGTAETIQSISQVDGKIVVTKQAISGITQDKITGLTGALNDKANDADLSAIAKSGNVNDLIQTDGDVLIFDCGDSTN